MVEAVENLEQVQLIVQVVLEPEHDLVFGQRGRKGRITGHQAALDDVGGIEAGRRQVGGPLATKGGVIEAGTHRPFVQHVVPRQRPARQPQVVQPCNDH